MGTRVFLLRARVFSHNHASDEYMGVFTSLSTTPYKAMTLYIAYAST